MGRTKNDGSIERTLYLQYDRSKADYGKNVVRDARAISANYVWTLRQFNSHTFPTGGFGIALAATEPDRSLKSLERLHTLYEDIRRPPRGGS